MTALDAALRRLSHKLGLTARALESARRAVGDAAGGLSDMKEHGDRTG